MRGNIQPTSLNIFLRAVFTRPIRLESQHDSFSDIDKGAKQDFEVLVNEFLHEEVFCLTITCILDCMSEDALYLLENSNKVILEHQPLEVPSIIVF